MRLVLTPVKIAATILAAPTILAAVFVAVNPGEFRERRSRALGDAAWDGELWKVQLCLRLGSDVNEICPGKGSPPVIDAAWNGHTQVVRFFLDHGALINKRDKYGWTALIAAAESGHIDTVRYLLTGGASVNATGWDGSALRLAREHGHPEVCELLIQHGAVDRSGFEADR